MGLLHDCLDMHEMELEILEIDEGRVSVGACGLVDRALSSISTGLGFDAQYWSCEEVSGKLLIPYYLCLPSTDGYLVEQGKLYCNDWL